ncbi:MAG: lysostaphin resistance A-like protein [Phycisphaerales bacterium]
MAWILALVLIVLTVVVQQSSKEEAAPTVAVGSVAAVEFDEVQLLSKILLKVQELTGQRDANVAEFYIDAMDGAARAEESRVRLAMVIGAALGPEAALRRIDLLEAEPAPESESAGTANAPPWGRRPLKSDSPLRGDLEYLRHVYEADDGGALVAAEGEWLTSRHGFYARALLLQGTSAGDPARKEVFGGGAALMAFLLLVGGGVLLIFVAGFAMAIVAAIMLFQGKVRPALVPPGPGGSVPIETLVVFIVGFLGLHFALDLLLPALGLEPGTARTVALLSQWVLALVIFYPLLRGVSWAETRRMFGLHAGRGVFREIGAGVGGYLASIPVFVVGVVCAMVLILTIAAVKAGLGYPEDPPIRSPLADLFSGSSVLTLLVLASLTMVWAPLVEETVFRGALLRQLGTRFGWVWCAVLSALAFALMHNYHPAQLIPIFILGCSFAAMRVWRGSLIASITGHCLHNSMVTILLIGFITLLK